MSSKKFYSKLIKIKTKKVNNLTHRLSNDLKNRKNKIKILKITKNQAIISIFISVSGSIHVSC